MRMPLAVAERYARQVLEEIAPYCERAEIAGSIRRRRPLVNDIDLVIIPRDPEGLRRRCLERCHAITHGDSNFSFETPTGVQIDFFSASPDEKDLFAPKIATNWGSVMVCRTGSAAHNIMLCQRAHKLGLRWNPARGVMDGDGNLVASATEEEIFAALHMEFVPPERREVSDGKRIEQKATEDANEAGKQEAG